MAQFQTQSAIKELLRFFECLFEIALALVPASTQLSVPLSPASRAWNRTEKPPTPGIEPGPPA